MSDVKQIITHLNKILKNELTAINQYFLHARILEHQGYNKLAQKAREESIDEMKHADIIMKRILFLGGLPNLQDLGRLQVGETPKEMLEADLTTEKKALKDLKEARHFSDHAGDACTTNLLEDIICSEEEHLDWLRKQLDIIAAIGIENYLQSQL